MPNRTRAAIQNELKWAIKDRDSCQRDADRLTAELAAVPPDRLKLPTAFGNTFEVRLEHFGSDGIYVQLDGKSPTRGLRDTETRALRDWLNYHFPVAAS